MRIALFAVLAVLLSGFGASSIMQPPPSIAGCTREVIQYTAFVPFALQLRLIDAGFPMTLTAVPFKRLKGRAWVCPSGIADGGTITFLPRLAKAAQHFRDDLDVVVDPSCSDGTLCPGQDTGDATNDDGGADPLVEVPFECACAVTATCLLTIDGGVAPQGMTLGSGVWTGAGCKPKSCGTIAVYRTFPDGGPDFDISWPAVCPVP